ncbi:MAG: SMC-Scp complex subunit ScpB [Planctomycetota bacterium]
MTEKDRDNIETPLQNGEAADDEIGQEEIEDCPDSLEQLQQEQMPKEAEDSDVEVTTESVVEAVLFASDEPLTAARLSSIAGTSARQIRQYINNLNDKYKENNNAFRIEQIAGGYQMLTLSPYNIWLKKLLRERSESKLSPAALETLAIISYKQPIIRADIEAIRGVAAGEMLRGLMYKGLIKIVGRAQVLGRPLLYGTTRKFLEVFGLNSLKDLPKIEELKKPEA